MGPRSCGALGVSPGGGVPGVRCEQRAVYGRGARARSRAQPRGFGPARAGTEQRCPRQRDACGAVSGRSAAPGHRAAPCRVTRRRAMSRRMRGGGAGSGRCRPLSSPQRRGAAALLLPAQRYGDRGRRTHGVPVTGEGGPWSGVLGTGSVLALGGLPETDVPRTLPPHPAR